MKERLKRWLTAKIKWPAFGPTVEMEDCLNTYADKIIIRVSTAVALGGEENLRENVKDDLRRVFHDGGFSRIERLHRRIRNLEIEIRSGKI